jgi:hypothetical protein
MACSDTEGRQSFGLCYIRMQSLGPCFSLACVRNAICHSRLEDLLCGRAVLGGRLFKEKRSLIGMGLGRSSFFFASGR